MVDETDRIARRFAGPWDGQPVTAPRREKLSTVLPWCAGFVLVLVVAAMIVASQ